MKKLIFAGLLLSASVLARAASADPQPFYALKAADASSVFTLFDDGTFALGSGLTAGAAAAKAAPLLGIASYRACKSVQALNFQVPSSVPDQTSMITVSSDGSVAYSNVTPSSDEAAFFTALAAFMECR